MNIYDKLVLIDQDRSKLFSYEIENLEDTLFLDFASETGGL